MDGVGMEEVVLPIGETLIYNHLTILERTPLTLYRYSTVVPIIVTI